MFLPFRAGQYMHLEWIAPPLPEVKGEGRSLFVASPPVELPFLTFFTRIGNSPFKVSGKGYGRDALRISGPFGSLSLPRRLGGR